MSQIEILLPKMGESVAEATIIKWLKNDGDRVEADEPIVEIATDKVDSEVPAPQEGILVKRLVNEGDVVKVGQPIAHIAAEGAATAAPVAPAPAAAAPPPPAAVSNGAPSAKPVAVAAASVGQGTPAGARSGPSGKFYSPLVRNIAQSEGITLEELEAIAGSGQGGRVTKKDLLDYLPQRGSSPAPAGSFPNHCGASGHPCACPCSCHGAW